MKRSELFNKLRQILLRRREALRQTLDDEIEHLGDEREDFDDGVNFELAHSESRELWAIENALDQLREGTYGCCEECGHSIPAPRLQALPYATTCIDCQRTTEVDGRTVEKTHDKRLVSST